MKRKKIILMSLIWVIAFIINTLSLTYPSRSISATQPTVYQSTVKQSNEDKSLNTPSYYLINAQNQDILLAQNETLQRAPASTVKLLTGLVAMQTLHEEDVVTLGNEVVIENSTLGLKPGDTLLVKDLLTALYLPSSNDAAVALAVAAKGSLPAFVEAMNQYALQLGCNSSRFQTPNGLPALDQYSTAQDLSKIAIDFIHNKTLMQYVEKEEGKVEWTGSNGLKKSIIVNNTNEFLGLYPGVQGLKTGTTTEAGQCLVTYITRMDGDLILVLLGSENRYKDTQNLLDRGISTLRTQAALRNIGSSPESMIQTPGFFQ
ncbi:D-alanyl-D-alanine carboxypeptidase family protein [Desulfitobacterium metallireducens]|uniref:D-alanyl-D-alanine carboxypeptidase n=1 Tax=Desulfitobacterium metallireducens DSM 15288 TaxID=871968 RepID=W0ED13_9FIRM|nr:serine hydrolase [Desulfitobacterium metallireducens]AHF06966.1 D-alanyl-D-alanine carboxypeptidase [Desulfitobacterium metallireducens DSM 15288]